MTCLLIHSLVSCSLPKIGGLAMFRSYSQQLAQFPNNSRSSRNIHERNDGLNPPQLASLRD